MNQSLMSLGTKTAGGFTKFSAQDVQRIIESKDWPVVKTASNKSFPVDELGFIYAGSARWELDVPPSEEHIERAIEVLRGIPKTDKKKGSWKRISLSDLKVVCENDPDFRYITNGAFIVAASRLLWRIEQEEIYGLIAVPRGWWNKFSG